MEQPGESGNHITAAIAAVEEPVITLSATEHAQIRALLNVMEGRLDTLERDLLNDFRKSLDRAKDLIGQDVGTLRTLTRTGTAGKP